MPGTLIDITLATTADARDILLLQRLAYQSEAALYNDHAIPPLTQTLEELQTEFGRQTILKAMLDGQIVGSVRAREQNGTCHIGRLIVHPDHQRKGIGTALMHAIEARFPLAACFELFTGHKSDANIRLYERLGYHIFLRKPVSESLTLVYLQKTRST